MPHLALRSRLCYVAHSSSEIATSLSARAATALRGGAGLILYRATGRTTRQMVDEASDLLVLTRRAGVPLAISERVDVALAATAGGAQLGPSDMPPAVARRLLGPDAIIGARVGGIADLREAERQGASYVAVGPLFPDPDLPQTSPVEPALLREIVAAAILPVLAYGGLSMASLVQVPLDGYGLLAVGRLVDEAADPLQAVREVVRMLATP